MSRPGGRKPTLEDALAVHDLSVLLNIDGSPEFEAAQRAAAMALRDRGWLLLRPPPFSELLAAAREALAAAESFFDGADEAGKDAWSLAHGYGYVRGADREAFRTLTGTMAAGRAGAEPLTPKALAGPLDDLSAQFDSVCATVCASLAPGMLGCGNTWRAHSSSWERRPPTRADGEGDEAYAARMQVRDGPRAIKACASALQEVALHTRVPLLARVAAEAKAAIKAATAAKASAKSEAEAKAAAGAKSAASKTKATQALTSTRTLLGSAATTAVRVAGDAESLAAAAAEATTAAEAASTAAASTPAGYGMIDIVRYRNHADAETDTGRDFNVDAHVDPGLFALSVIDTAPGLQLYDPQTDRWLSPRAFPPPAASRGGSGGAGGAGGGGVADADERGADVAKAPVFVLWAGVAASAAGIARAGLEPSKPGLHRVLRAGTGDTPRATIWYEVCAPEQVAAEVRVRGLHRAPASDARDRAASARAGAGDLAGDAAAPDEGAHVEAPSGKHGRRYGRGLPLPPPERWGVGVRVRRFDGSLRWMPEVDAERASVDEVKHRIELDVGIPFSKSVIVVNLEVQPRAGAPEPGDSGARPAGSSDARGGAEAGARRGGRVRLQMGHLLSEYGIRNGDIIELARY